ncbi:hypothetical protein ACFFMM_24740 [Micromonospora chaiyaphumensis]|uniref:Integral membrane protein n=1 Tax=Micromonospora chaiyaphumensis TaxID=307119 RepID=A0A1C4UN39_9ACTN|nr:hypothetical protein [Micromonospora chaiyaphumensis]SCE73119.1 hypothetical protein GA0070214_101858 [Micromonospora chaiyaphumensis]
MSDTPGSSDERPVEVVELRVHGVSGAGPEHVLDRPNVYQVAGDSSGGFYRPRTGYPDTTGSGGVLLEAYRWRDLPSGRAVRTLSLVFLLPFMLGNLAIWMHPSGAGLAAATVKALCRLLALTLTAVYVIAVAGVTLDLIAWKCMGSPRCLTGRNWLSWLGERPPGLRLAVLALVPVAAVALVWRLSSRPGWTYASFRGPATTSGQHQLTAVSQWDTAPLVSRLRAIHVAAAFATLDAALLAARSAGGRASVATTALLVLTAAVLAACVVLVCVHPLLDRATPAPRVDRNLRRLRTAACLLTAAVVVVVVAEPGPWAAGTGLPWYGEIVTLLFATQTVLLVVLGAAVLWARPRVPGGPRLRALGTPVIMAVAAGAGVAYSAELVYRVADLLDRGAPTSARLATSPPLAYKWAIFAFFVGVTVAAVAGVVTALASGPARRRAAADIVTRDHPDAPVEAAGRLREVEKVIARARFTERMTPLVLTYAALAGLGLATSTLGLARWYPGDVIDRWAPIPADLVNFGIGLGSYVIAAAIVGLVLGGLFAYRTPEFRRYVGVLWDLGTFWPRAAHPFAPPCYAERAVPELSRRISYLTGQGQTVLLAGHSHGSILLAATVLQLPPEVCARVALLTSGSPLSRLYARWFPAYVNADVLHEIGERVGWRWINLWRDTDAIGGWVFSPNRPGGPPPADGPAGSVDWRLRDPRGLVAPPSDTVPPPIVRHLPGATDPRHNEAVRELADRLRDLGPGPPTG